MMVLRFSFANNILFDVSVSDVKSRTEFLYNSSFFRKPKENPSRKYDKF